jgi:hypothetical protein
MGEINQKRSGGGLMSKFNVNVNVLEVNNGDITKVEYNGIIFEKSAELIYRKVDRKAKVGDFLLFESGTSEYLTDGKYYEVTRIDDAGDAQVIDDEGDNWDSYGDNFEVYEVINSKKVAEVETTKFSVGDYVKLTIEEGGYPEHGWGRVRNGDIGVITSVETEKEITVEFPNQKHWNGVISEFVKVSEEEVAQAKAEQERKQAEKEIDAKWAKIGRKPNEFKKGDVVRVVDVSNSRHEVGDIGEITEFAGDTFRVNTHRISRVNWLGANHVELIAPVESRFDEAK